MAKRGRPRALNINPTAVHDLLAVARRDRHDGPKTQIELAAAAGVTPSHLTDMLRRQKGTRLEVVERMAFVLNCSVETIAPTLGEGFVAVRNGDTLPDEAA